MREAFRLGHQVVIYVIGGAKISGEITAAGPVYVTVKEERRRKEKGAQPLEVCVNYSAITHVYPNVEKPKEVDHSKVDLSGGKKPGIGDV